MLVTSHYNDVKLREHALILNTKILPKELATEIGINVALRDNFTLNNPEHNSYAIKAEDSQIAQVHNAKEVDLVLLDDDEIVVDSFTRFLFEDMRVDTYFHPRELLENITKYPTDTKIAIDNNYKNSSLKGTDIAKILYEQGYTKLYILSGQNPEDINCKHYATALFKMDLDSIGVNLSKAK